MLTPTIMYYFVFITQFFNHWDVQVVLVLIKSYTHGELSMHSSELGDISMSHQLLKWRIHVTPVAFTFGLSHLIRAPQGARAYP